MKRFKIAYGGYLLLVLLPILLCIFPIKSTQAARQGIAVWAEGVVPSMFPFAVLSKLLISFVDIHKIPDKKSHIFLLSVNTFYRGALGSSKNRTQAQVYE